MEDVGSSPTWGSKNNKNVLEYICKICNKNLKSFKSLSTHLLYHNCDILSYYILYENFIIPKCKICGKNAKHKKGLKFQKTCCSEYCISENSSRLKHSEETKINLSNFRKNYLKNNPDNHTWKRNDKYISKPCEILKQILSENGFKFISEYTPLQHKNYSIDIAFPQNKIGIEVNGNQHYNKDKTLKDYYIKRNNEIEQEGWKIYNINYIKIYNKKFIEELINFLNKNTDNIDLSFEFYKKIKKEYFCIECGINKVYEKDNKCIKCSNLLQRKVKNRPSIEQLLKDITELGYCGTGRKYGVSDTAIRKWLKK